MDQERLLELLLGDLRFTVRCCFLSALLLLLWLSLARFTLSLRLGLRFLCCCCCCWFLVRMGEREWEADRLRWVCCWGLRGGEPERE